MNPFGAGLTVSTWRRPSYCQGGECAEVAKQDDMIALRSSTAPGRVVLYTIDEWQALVRAIKAGEFADLA